GVGSARGHPGEAARGRAPRGGYRRWPVRLAAPLHGRPRGSARAGGGGDSRPQPPGGSYATSAASPGGPPPGDPPAAPASADRVPPRDNRTPSALPGRGSNHRDTPPRPGYRAPIPYQARSRSWGHGTP